MRQEMPPAYGPMRQESELVLQQDRYVGAPQFLFLNRSNDQQHWVSFMKGQMQEIEEKGIPRPLSSSDLKKGRDEMNFAEFPLASLAERIPKGVKTLTFEDVIKDSGTKQEIHRKLTISGSDRYGLPTAMVSDVVLGLMKLTEIRNSFQSPLVHFSRYELIRFLRWPYNGRSYNRLRRALNVLAGVTLFYDQSWWDMAGKSWRSRAFHILESFDLRGKQCPGEAEEPTSSFRWNGVVFQSFVANYTKSLDLDVYFKLTSAAAKRAYRYLDKHFYKKAKWEFDLHTFAFNHLGYSRSYSDITQLKRRLNAALKELEEIGFLLPATEAERYRKEGRGRWTIILERNRTASSQPRPEESPPIAKVLIDKGISEAAAKELASSFSESEIMRQVEACEEILAKRPTAFSNPAGYLVKAIRESYQVRGQFKPSEPVAKAVSRPAPVVEPVDAKPDSRQLLREAFLSEMTDNERKHFETEAFREADSLSIAGHKRAIESGSDERVNFYREVILNQKIDRAISERELRIAS
jgi:hypothetical protein